MTKNAGQLSGDALQLPEEERLELAMELLGSVIPEVPGLDRPDQEWIEEIERRARAAASGETGLSWQDVRAEIEGKLARK
jgi:putative addiction module component (TIGR02574 family)